MLIFRIIANLILVCLTILSLPVCWFIVLMLIWAIEASPNTNPFIGARAVFNWWKNLFKKGFAYIAQLGTL